MAYPDFHFLLLELFGLDFPALSLLKTFGFIVALSFLAAGYTLYLELRRREKNKTLSYQEQEVVFGKKPSIVDLVLTALFSFIAGYKFVGLFADREIASPDPLGYIFSSQGSLIAGIVAMIAFTAIKLLTNKKEREKYPEEVTKKVRTYPSMRVGDIAVAAAVGGFGGAKLFNTFENWDSFIQDPFGSLTSSMGLTFYGGLIVGAAVVIWYARRIKLDIRQLCDAAAPGLLLAYAIGRLGCQVAGDGDWGIYNSGFKLDENQHVVSAKKGEFDQFVKDNEQYFKYELEKYGKVPNKYVNISWLPDILQAQRYKNNVAKHGALIKGYDGPKDYSWVLANPVFPTPIYEFLMGTFLFMVLWSQRKKWKVPLTMFGVYLIFNGIERFFIEQFRVNFVYSFGLTQAEVIALVIMLVGIAMLVMRKKIDALLSKSSSESPLS